ncbi:zinc ion binding protein [Stemphylium lycopersici]|nr:zinc ion binding protein [Stemphylium lycopersici]RAR10061.1 zinc ion binding protein [Stemphylium lycopersici]
MREIDAHFDAYEHLKHLPRDGEALHTLRKAASMVKPMMRKRGWKVGTLAEFLPDEPQLLGLNINRTERILIRLRYHYDSRQFLSLEQVTDTLLHELCHIVIGPHNADFNNLWNELRDEHQSLLMKGYTGEGFLSQGQKLGGRRIPLDEMRRQARIAAEKRRTTTNANAGGHRLGGSRPVGRAIDMRRVIADAASRRSSITDGCASGSSEAGRLVNQQEQDGFRTKAEQDDANDWAIAQALQDLMYDEEMQRLGAPTGNGGLSWDPQNGLQFDSNPPSRTASPALPTAQSYPTRNTTHPGQGRPLSRLVTQSSSRTSGNPTPVSARTPSRLISQEEEQLRNKQLPPTPPQVFQSPQPDMTPTNPNKWACPQCTLHNPLDYLACEACGLEQPPQPIPEHRRFGPSHISPSLPKPPPQSGLRGRGATPFEPAKGRLGWNCLECGTFMHSLREFGTIYGDGFVETFVPVPSKPQSFSVHLTSNKFIAPGVAIFVYVDGVYQCNRNRQDLKLRKPSDSRSLVDFRVRQKEEKQKDGSMIAREWTFDKLNIASANDAPNLCSPNILENIGCIEVLVLRCAGSRNAKYASTVNFDGAGDWPGHYFGLDQDSSPSNKKSIYDDRGPHFKDTGSGFGPPPPFSSYRAPYAESMHSHKGSASRSHRTSHNIRDASPRASMARHSKPISRYSEAIGPGVRLASNPPFSGFHYGSGPIPRNEEPLQRRPSAVVAQNITSVDPVWLNNLLTMAVEQGVESRRMEGQSEGHAKHWKRNSKKEVTSQAPGAWPESPFQTPAKLYHEFERTTAFIHDNDNQPGSEWNQPQDGWGRSEARSRAGTRVNWTKEPVWETGSSNGDGWSSHEELPSDSWDTEETWATNKAHEWETSSQPAKPTATAYFKTQSIALAPSHTHGRRRPKHSLKNHQSCSNSRTKRSRSDYEITSSSSEDKDYMRIEPSSESVVSLSSSDKTTKPPHFRIQRQIPRQRSRSRCRQSKSAKRDNDRTLSHRSRHTSTLQQAPVETAPAPSVATRMTPTIVNAPVEMAATQPQPQQPSVHMNPATSVLPAPEWVADVHQVIQKDSSIPGNIAHVPYPPAKTGFAQSLWGVSNKGSLSASSSSWDSGKKYEWENIAIKNADWGIDDDRGWEKADPRSYVKSVWDTNDDEAGGWKKDDDGKKSEAVGWDTKDIGWGVARAPRDEEKNAAANDLIGLKNALENVFEKKTKDTGTPLWKNQSGEIQNDSNAMPGLQLATANPISSAPPAEKPASRRHSNKSLSKYRSLRPDFSSTPTLKPHWQFPPPPSSTQPLCHILEDQTYIAPKEPRYTVTQATASEKGLKYQVRAGRATDYGHAVGRPEYLDSLDKPYAVFRFKYRSPEVLTALFGHEAKTKKNKKNNANAEGEAVEKLKALPQEELIAKMLKLESKLAETKTGAKDRNKHGDRQERNWRISHHAEQKNADVEKRRRESAQTEQVAKKLTEVWVKRHSRDPSEKAGSRHAKEAAFKNEGNRRAKKTQEKEEGCAWQTWGEGDKDGGWEGGDVTW